MRLRFRNSERPSRLGGSIRILPTFENPPVSRIFAARRGNPPRRNARQDSSPRERVCAGKAATLESHQCRIAPQLRSATIMVNNGDNSMGTRAEGRFGAEKPSYKLGTIE